MVEAPLINLRNTALADGDAVVVAVTAHLYHPLGNGVIDAVIGDPEVAWTVPLVRSKVASLELLTQFPAVPKMTFM